MSKGSELMQRVCAESRKRTGNPVITEVSDMSNEVKTNEAGIKYVEFRGIRYSVDVIDEVKADAVRAAAPDLLEACKAALNLAWEVGSESEDGVLTLLDDSRGDLYRQLSAAIAKAGQG